MKDAISRTSGVGDVQLFGSQYAMRIWMNPNELNKFQANRRLMSLPPSKRRTPRLRRVSRWYAAGERPTA
ncbi:efflux RND transporter permease subunit [Escherichia coli]